MRFIALVILLVSFSASANITEGGRGMLFGQDHAFAVTAAPNWVLDNESAVNQGLHKDYIWFSIQKEEPGPTAR